MGRTVLLLFAAAALVARAQVKLPDTSDLTTTVIKAGVYVPFSNIDGSLREWGKWRDVALAIAVAADDFNARDPRVVAAFDTPCNLTMDLVFIDSFSSTVSVANARSFLSYAATKGGPAIDLNIGGATTDESAMLGVLAGIDSQLLVAHGGSTASKLSGSDYPTLVRTVTSSVEPTRAVADCVLFFAWQKVGIIAEQGFADYVSSLIDALVDYGVDYELRYVDWEALGASGTTPVDELFDGTTSKIWISVCTDEANYYVLTQAEAEGKISEYNAWIFTHASQYFLENFDLAYGALSLSLQGQSPYPYEPWDALSDAMADADVDAYDARFFNATANPSLFLAGSNAAGGFPRGSTLNGEAAFAYDAVAVAALASCDAAAAADTPKAPFAKVSAAAELVDFAGASGRVVLDAQGDRNASTAFITLKNVRRRNGTQVVATVGDWDPEKGWVPLGNGPAEFYDPALIPDYQNPTCDGGYFNESAYACVDCAAGEESAPDGAAACVPCAPGSARDPAAADVCTGCANMFVYAEGFGNAFCASCPDGSARVPDVEDAEMHEGKNLTECECMEGYYSSVHAVGEDVRGFDYRDRGATWGAPGVACHACPEGAACPGGGAPPRNVDGYWGDPNYPTAFYEADDAEEGFVCASGFKGRLCATLEDPDFYMIGDIGPFACPASLAGRWLNVLFGFSVVLGIWVFLREPASRGDVSRAFARGRDETSRMS